MTDTPKMFIHTYASSFASKYVMTTSGKTGIVKDSNQPVQDMEITAIKTANGQEEIW